MKKIGIIAGIILVTIIAGILLMKGSRVDTEVTKQETKVGFIINGSIADGSWGQSHYEGLTKSADKLNLNIICREEVPETEACVEVLEELVEEGCEIIICNSFQYGEWELQVAKEHPDVYFFHATGVTESKNLATYFGRVYQMRYLCGIVAGLQTNTNEIGYVAAFPIPEVIRGINAFTLGVRSVNPEAKVYVRWCYDWNADDAAAMATNGLIADHDIDVLTMHTDSLEPLEIAEEKGIYSIGYNLDNSGNYPGSYLTAAVWDWEKFYTPRILECLQGKFQGKHYWEGADTGLVYLSPLTDNVKPGIEEKVREEEKRLQSGSYDVFYGPITDSDGMVRVAEGESMTDDVMLNSFTWYVEGVYVDEE